MPDDPFSDPRQRMLAVIAARTIFACARLDKAALAPRVMAVMGRIPRHEFVPPEWRAEAYADTPLPIGFDKTISQPFIVAVMTDLLDLQPTDTVLEVGTGLGYQTAVLAALARQVCTIELIAGLAERAQARLARRGHTGIEFRVGDGRAGWPERAPFDKVIVTAAPEAIPPALIEQLKPGGRMVIPAGRPAEQRLMLVLKDAAGSVSTRPVFPVRFSQLDRVAPG